MTRRHRCTVQYVGTGFAGFQRQPGRPTVQGALEEAISSVTQRQTSVMGAGRTDAGVHALGQVVHFDTESSLTCADLQRAVNACLPESVSITRLEDVPSGFHARFDATGREYQYVVDNAEVRSPLLARRAHFVRGALDLPIMQEAAEWLEGTHDFAAFGSPMTYTRIDATSGLELDYAGGTVRTMTAAKCWAQRRLVIFYFVADAFLRHMVRMLVGTLLRVGAGRLPARTIADLLRGDRTVPAGPAAPAYGLYLVRVRYE